MKSRMKQELLVIQSRLGLFFFIILRSSLAFCGHEEDVRNAHSILDQVDHVLYLELNRSNAPSQYRDTYHQFNSKLGGLRDQLSVDPQAVGALIGAQLRQLGMSHLDFQALPRGSYGLESTPDGGGTVRVTQVDSWGPAAGVGIRPGDRIEEIDGGSAEAALTQGVRADSAYSKSIWVVRSRLDFSESYSLDTRKVSIQAVPVSNSKRGTLGILDTALTDGTLQVNTVFPNSPAESIGIVKGDLILSVNGASALEFKKGIGDRDLGQEVEVVIQKQDQSLQIREVKLSSRRVFDRTFFQQIDYQGRGATYLRIRDFASYYLPEAVHQAVIDAEKSGLLVVDLRNNLGGHVEHFLSFFLKPHSPLYFHVGEQIPKSSSLARVEKISLLKKSISSKFKNVVSVSTSGKCFLSDEEQMAGIYEDMRIVNGLVIEELSYFYSKEKEYHEILELHNSTLMDLVEGILIPECKIAEEIWETKIQMMGHSESGSSEAQVLKNEISEDIREFGERREGLAKDWIVQFFNDLERILKKQPDVNDRLRRLPQDLENSNFIWSSKVKTPPRPYFGKVAFLVDHLTYCAAELCALIPFEYQKLRSQGQIGDLKYSGHLYPEAIQIFGQTDGAAQILKEVAIVNPLGKFILLFPGGDVHTYISQTRLENTGVKGIPYNLESSSTTHFAPPVIQALEWGFKN